MLWANRYHRRAWCPSGSEGLPECYVSGRAWAVWSDLISALEWDSQQDDAAPLSELIFPREREKTRIKAIQCMRYVEGDGNKNNRRMPFINVKLIIQHHCCQVDLTPSSHSHYFWIRFNGFLCSRALREPAPSRRQSDAYTYVRTEPYGGRVWRHGAMPA